jgi:hypothetical protein
MIHKSINILFHGMKFGILSSIIGCAAFVLIEQTRLILKFGFGGKTEIEFTVLLFLVASGFALIPTILGSGALSLLLYSVSRNKRLTVSRSIYAGVVIGILTSFGMSIIGGMLLNGRGSLTVYLFHSIEVIIIASFSGGWTGKKLAEYLLNDTSSIAS